MAAEKAKRALADAGVELADVVFQQRVEDAVADCDAVLLVTKWAEYAHLPKLLRDQG